MLKGAYYAGTEQMLVDACRPLEPGPGQVQLEVSHCGICGTDLHVFLGHMNHRVKTPQVIGHEMSGTVRAAGAGVEGFTAGDRVTVMPLDPCGSCPACKAGHGHVCQKLKFIGIDTPGALQALWTVPAHTLHRIPDNLSLEQAALIEPIAVACHDVRLGDVKAGEYVVVIGGGPIGMLVALVARNRGARVLVTEVNPFRTALGKQIGLDVVDPRAVDVHALVTEQTGDAGADVVFEVSGTEPGAALMTQIARVRGRIVVVAIFAQPTRIDLFRCFWRELQVRGARVYEHEDFDEAIRIAAAGAIPFDRLITDIYALDQVEQGLRQMQKGGEVMKVLVRCSPE